MLKYRFALSLSLAGQAQGVCKGHKRGVWCVKFSPVDKVVVSSSADATLRLWSLTDSSCLKTFEGHDGSVLKCAFICNGMQVGYSLYFVFDLHL